MSLLFYLSGGKKVIFLNNIHTRHLSGRVVMFQCSLVWKWYNRNVIFPSWSQTKKPNFPWHHCYGSMGEDGWWIGTPVSTFKIYKTTKWLFETWKGYSSPNGIIHATSGLDEAFSTSKSEYDSRIKPYPPFTPPRQPLNVIECFPFLSTVFLLMGALVAFSLCSICSQLTDKLNLLADAGRLAWCDPKAVFGEGIFRMKAVSVQLWERIKHGRNSMPKGLFQSPLLTSFAFFSLLFFSPYEFSDSIHCPPFQIWQPVSFCLTPFFYSMLSASVYISFICVPADMCVSAIIQYGFFPEGNAGSAPLLLSTYHHLPTALFLPYCIFWTCPGVPIYFHSMFWEWVCVYSSP